jgi:hypothetical protein
MSRVNILGWVLMLAGCGLWAYGYFVTGHPSLVKWSDVLPGWLAEYVPNLEAEAGLAIMIVAMVPTYWPDRRSDGSSGSEQPRDLSP